MKSTLIFSLLIACLFVLMPTTTQAGSSPSDELIAAQKSAQLDKMADKDGDGVLSEKELKQRQKLENRMAKLSDRIEKKMQKRQAKASKKTNAEPGKLALLSLGLAVLLSIVAVVVAAASVTGGSAGGLGLAGIFWILGSLAWLAAFVFFIMWLVQMAS